MTAPAFIAQAFALRTQAHYAHLRTRSYAQHKALEEFYDGITGLADTFAEVWMGMNGLIDSFPAVKLAGAPSPKELLMEYLDYLDEYGPECAGKDMTLLNTLADMRELTAQTLYKLKFLG